MVDRLNELKKGSEWPDQLTLHVDSHDGSNNNINTNSKGNKLPNFLSDIENIIKLIHIINRSINQIEKHYDSTNKNDINSNDAVNTIIRSTNETITITKRHINKLQSTKPNNEQDRKIYNVQVNLITTNFIKSIKEYQRIQSLYKINIQDNIRRQIVIANPTISAEEVDNIMTSDMSSSDFVKNVILFNDASDVVKNAHLYVSEKYNDILSLEKSIASLNAMFVDLSTITEYQGDLLNSIETQVFTSSEYIEKANEELDEAVGYQISMRQKQLCLFFLVIVLLGGISVFVCFLKGIF